MASRTPQNTPANNAPISSHATAPNLGNINEGEHENLEILMCRVRC